MANKTQTQPSQTFDVAEALAAERFEYIVPEGDTLARLTILQTIHDDIALALNGASQTVMEAKALEAQTLRRKDAGVLAVAELLETIPSRVVQASLHRVYGGKLVSGKTSKTIPDGDGETFLKAAKAYRDVVAYATDGIIPESWTRGAGTRGAIAELLPQADRVELLNEVNGRSKVNVSDTVTRFFRDLAPTASPVWANPDKLNEIAENILVNAEYIAENAEIVRAYRTLIAAFNSAVKD